MSRELFSRRQRLCSEHLRGGLGIATVAACGGFAAICGSSVADRRPTFSGRVPIPEMAPASGIRNSFATGGDLRPAARWAPMACPPSTVAGRCTASSPSRTSASCSSPHHSTAVLANDDVHDHHLADRPIFRPPVFLPTGPQTSWREPALTALRKYLGAGAAVCIRDRRIVRDCPSCRVFTPTEAGGGRCHRGAFPDRRVHRTAFDKEKDSRLAWLQGDPPTAAAVFHGC